MGHPAADHLAVLILAGGRGERFWPRSRASLPKQFLRLSGGGTLLQETFRRARRLVPAGKIYVVTPARYRDLTCRQLPDLSPENLILEPFGRDTAPCIGLGAVAIEARDPGAVLVVLPADHLIADEERFLSVLDAAARVAAGGRWLVTVGVTPTRPETGYGYIQFGGVVGREGPWEVRAVRRFTEKPAAEQAMGFLASGEYLWNSGVFAWKASLFLRMVALHLPSLAAGLERIAAARDAVPAGVGAVPPGTGEPGPGTDPPPGAGEALRREYEAFERVSVDYGLLERADNVVVIPADFGWDDVGSWAALDRIRTPDERGNVTEGPVVTLETRDCIVCAGEQPAVPAAPGPGRDGRARPRLVVTYGVDGLLLVDTPDALLVADKSRCATLKQVVEELRRRGLGRYLDEPAVPEVARDAGGSWIRDALPPPEPRGRGPDGSPAPRVVEKPWGRETWWAVTDRYLAKVILVRAGHSLSLQYHREKLETMLFCRGSGTVLLGDRELPIEAGLCVTIPPGTVHRVVAETDVVFYEVSSPEAEDVVRLADAYGRADVP